MLPYVVDGILGGAIYALAALGLVLTYKTIRRPQLRLRRGGHVLRLRLLAASGPMAPFPMDLDPVLVLVVAPLLGLLLEQVFRPMASQSAEVQIVVALAILSVFLTVIPIIWNDTDRALPTIFPHGQFQLTEPVTVTCDRLFTFVLALVLAGGLYVLLRHTRLGTATRAVVDNRDLAGLDRGQCQDGRPDVMGDLDGVRRHRRRHARNRELPGHLHPAVPGLLLLRPRRVRAADLLSAGLHRGRIARRAAERVREVQQHRWVARWEAGIPYLALFLVLVVYGGRLKELRSSLRPLVGGGLGGSPWKGFSTGVAGLILAVAVLPHVLSNSYQHDVAEAMAYAVVALTLVVLTGWTGQISIAQMTFAGVGAFTAAHLAGTDGGRFLPAVLLGALICDPVSG